MNGNNLVVFRFGVMDTSGEDFLARTRNATVIVEARAQLALPPGKRVRYITGLIHRIPLGLNLGWRWQHIDSAWSFAIFSIEVCDAMPSHVEAHLDEWLKGPGRFCPQSCRIKQEEAS